MKVRKPKEGTGRARWQHRGRQRTRQWSKALWSAGCTQLISRGDTGDEMVRSAGERATAAATRYGCCRGEPFEGHGATGEENAGREIQPHHRRRTRVRVPSRGPRQRVPSPDEPSNAGTAATQDLNPSARRRVPEVRDEAGRRERDRQAGQPECSSTTPFDRCRSATAGEPGQAVRSARIGANGALMATSSSPKRGTGCSLQ